MSLFNQFSIFFCYIFSVHIYNLSYRAYSTRFNWERNSVFFFTVWMNLFLSQYYLGSICLWFFVCVLRILWKITFLYFLYRLFSLTGPINSTSFYPPLINYEFKKFRQQKKVSIIIFKRFPRFSKCVFSRPSSLREWLPDWMLSHETRVRENMCIHIEVEERKQTTMMKKRIFAS